MVTLAYIANTVEVFMYDTDMNWVLYIMPSIPQYNRNRNDPAEKTTPNRIVRDAQL